jgi:dolichyl-phosphate-mannose--protein O-mannosyl transferase
MRFYLTLTAVVFGLLTVVHIWRMVAESASLAKDPFFLIITVISAALCVWAVRLLVTSRRGTPSA